MITSNRPLSLYLRDGTTARIKRYPVDIKMPRGIKERRMRANLSLEIRISSIIFSVSRFHIKARPNYSISSEKSRVTSEKHGAMLNKRGFFNFILKGLFYQ
ncbi:MAG: hypothetical protein JSV82_06595 [Planctomycetota bacterium]|nr:MAG: hypothetical protein JSV82_06595 [Planctomycetota bacterium]